jgi:hypothetical protein
MNGYLGELKKSFLVTGVGSLPQKDALSAINFVFEALSYQIPFWPQLPQKSFLENMYVQFSEKFPGLVVDEAQKTVSVNTDGQPYMDALEECFNKVQADDVDYFSLSNGHAQSFHLFTQRLMALGWQGWVKAQIIGPFSFGLSLLDQNKKPILYNPELTELLPLFLSLKVSWMIRQIKVHVKTKIIIFIDEPYLVAVGTDQNTLTRQQVVDKINIVVRLIHANGALAGLHCCGNTDWDLVLSTEIDILNFDAYGYFDKIALYEKSLLAFLKKGGMPALGIVPTNDDLLTEGLEDKLFDVLKKHSKFLTNGALITPSCGLSGLSEAVSKTAIDMCVRLAERLKAEF